MKLVVIIPTYNEADNILKTIQRIKKETSALLDDIQILITDAKSPDRTYDIVKSNYSNDKNIHTILEKKKGGIGKAYFEAMSYAFDELKADAIITFDADLSHDPTKIKNLVERYKSGYDLVIGTRYKKGGGIPDNWGLHRKILSIGANSLINLMFIEYHITDFTSGYKLISRNVFKSIAHKIKRHNGYTFSISITLETLKNKFKIAEVPYKFKDREFGRSKIGFEYIVNGLKYIINVRVKTILSSRLGKVFMAGGLGGIFQILTYIIIFRTFIENANILNLLHVIDVGSLHFYPQLLVAQGFSIECGIFVSFYVNNNWAFKEHTLTGLKFIRRYIKNHIVVTGAILIQLLSVQIFSYLLGRNTIKDIIYQIFGILIGLIWNFYFYNRVIWKTHKSRG